MPVKHPLEDEINDFLNIWDDTELSSFLGDIIPLFELYDTDEKNDWVRDVVGEEDRQNVRLIRTVYLISKLSDLYGSKLVRLQAQFGKLWKRLENEAEKYEKMGCTEKG